MASNDYDIGKWVKIISQPTHQDPQRIYPPCGTIGQITDNYNAGDRQVYTVQFPGHAGQWEFEDTGYNKDELAPFELWNFITTSNIALVQTCHRCNGYGIVSIRNGDDDVPCPECGLSDDIVPF